MQGFSPFINLFLVFPVDHKGLSVQGMHCKSFLGNNGYAGSCQRKFTCANLKKTPNPVTIKFLLSRIASPHSILLIISCLLVMKSRN